MEYRRPQEHQDLPEDCDVFDDPSGALMVSPGKSILASKQVEFGRWMHSNREALDAALRQRGALLLRGFAVGGIEGFNDWANLMCPFATGYAGGATPRARVLDNVLESTRYPAHMHLSLHQEMSYLPKHPGRIAFYCVQPASKGGATIIGDMSRFTGDLPQETLEYFRDRAIKYIRVLRAPTANAEQSGFFHLYQKDWAETFSSNRRTEVETACAALGLSHQWRPDGSLVVESVVPAFKLHQGSGSLVWFNQVASMHVNPISHGAFYAKLVRRLPDENQWPYRVELCGSGSIPMRTLLPVYRGLSQVARPVRYVANDILVLDNVLMAHGREPYEGNREVHVALLQ